MEECKGDKFKDLLEDEELAALRLAALATKGTNESKSLLESALPINSILTVSGTASESSCNQIPFVQSDRSAHNWRKQNQSSRWRGGGAFPKSSQRSNLIVISPVALNEGKESKAKAPTLLLPQHRWCNSGNEDSMSPKTLRRTGPTRFNRHGSDSESSDDSEYDRTNDDSDDNDSGSNETILQDEPPEPFSCVSPRGDKVSENVERKRRLSFQRLDSEMKSDAFDKPETNSVYNMLKNSSSCTDKDSENYASSKGVNDCGLSQIPSLDDKYINYNQYNSSQTYSSKPLKSSENYSVKEDNHPVINRDSFPDKSNIINYNAADSANHTDDYGKSHYLSTIDKNRELMKRLDNMTPSADSVNNEINDSQRYDRKCLSQDYKGNDLDDLSPKSQSYKHELSSLNRKSPHRSLSPGRNTQENSPEINKYGQDLHLTKSRGELSSSQSRSRHERSSSRDKMRCDRSSSHDRIRQENSNHAANRHDRSLSPYRYSKGHSYRHDRSDSEERKPNRYRSTQGYRSPSESKKRRDRSSSSGSRREHSVSQERDKAAIYPGKPKDKHKKSKSDRDDHSYGHDKNRSEHSSGEDRSRHKHKKGKHKHRSKGHRRRHSRSSSHERNRRGRSWSRGSRSGHSWSCEKRKRSSSQGESNGWSSLSPSGKKNKIDHNSLNKEKSSQKYIQNQNLTKVCNDFQDKKSELDRSPKKGEGISIKEQPKSVELSCSKQNMNFKELKKSLQLCKKRSSSSESCSSAYSSSSSHNSPLKMRSVTSVIKAVNKSDLERNRGTSSNSLGKSHMYSTSTKKNTSEVASNKLPSVKSRLDGDLKASDNKRVPVHMRLGAFPRKRVIQMPKDVEAAFVNTSSSSDGENVSSKCKKQNIRITTDMFDPRDDVDLIPQKRPLDDTSAKQTFDKYQDKSKRMKIHT